jgi:UDP-N-acetylmuramoyl-tripeptide--D-alanyl-D-alanine ligase
VAFVSAAFGSGCSVVVVPEDWRGDVPAGRCAIRVPDPLRALVDLARRRRDAWNCPVLAVTGSAGKTSVKEMTAHARRGPPRVAIPGKSTPRSASPARWESQSGAECGASAPGEIGRLGRLVRPTSACVTIVAPAHLEGFGSVERVREEKLDLLRAVEGDGPRILDGDDPALAAAAAQLAGRVVRVGTSAACDPRLAHAAVRADGGMDFRLADGLEGRLAVPGEHQVRNALFAIALAAAHGVARREAIRHLAVRRCRAG